MRASYYPSGAHSEALQQPRTRKANVMLAKIRAFILGAIEFRSCVTTGFNDLALLRAYDHGRELAHKITCRRFDD